MPFGYEVDSWKLSRAQAENEFTASGAALLRHGNDTQRALEIIMLISDTH
jgi:hypothetical protein